LTFWRGIFAALVMLPFIRRRPRFRLPMIPMGLAFAAMTTTFLTSMVLGSESNTIWLQYLAPVWVALAGCWGWADRPQGRDWVMIAAAALGVGWILAFELAGVRPLSSVLAVLSGVTFAIVLICLRKLRDEEGAWLLTVNHLTTALCLAPFALTRVDLPTLCQIGALVLFAGLQLGLPYLLFVRGLRDVPSHEAALLSLIEPVTLPLWTFLAWQSYPDWWTVMGATVIAVGFMYRYWPTSPLVPHLGIDSSPGTKSAR
jgi:drug/metabolite transporter (DMT)-like permease